MRLPPQSLASYDTTYFNSALSIGGKICDFWPTTVSWLIKNWPRNFASVLKSITNCPELQKAKAFMRQLGHWASCIRHVSKGVSGGPAGPSREGPGVGYKIVSDTIQMTKERKKRKKMSGKRESCVKKKKGRKRERKMDRNKREEIKKCSKTRTETEILTC